MDNSRMKQKFITDYFSTPAKKVKQCFKECDIVEMNYDDKSNLINNNEKKVYGYNSQTDSWHCLSCGIDMGQNNPRQLCGKTYCDNY